MVPKSKLKIPHVLLLKNRPTYFEEFHDSFSITFHKIQNNVQLFLYAAFEIWLILSYNNVEIIIYTCSQVTSRTDY